MRIGVIGAGVMGERHARAISQLPYLTLAAVDDANPAVAERVGQALGAPAYTDTHAMLDRERLDAVTVATADQFHREPTVAALARGLAVFLEKPVASSLADADAIVTVAEQARAKVMVGHTLRYDARYRAVAQAARDGKLGDIIHLYARRNATTWSGKRIGGRASVTVFQGVHDFDAVRWITGAEVTRVYGASVSKALTELGVADSVMATLHLSNGAVAVVEQSWGVPYGVPAMLDARLEVVGTLGAAYVDMTPQGLSLFTDGRYTQPDTIYADPGLHMLKDAYQTFVAYVQGQGEPVASLADGVAALRIALAVDESARIGQPVSLV